MVKNKQVTSFIGSLNQGMTYELVNKLEKKLCERFDNISTNHFNGDNIEQCRGCKKCIQEGNCVLSDGFEELKISILASELIIFATPIYVKNISGTFKTFLDRLLSWYHLMPLVGRMGVIIVDTYNTGMDEVISYLYKVISSLGITIIGIITYEEVKSTNIDNQIEIVLNSINRILYYDKVIHSNMILEKNFQSYNLAYRNMVLSNDLPNFELNEWTKKGYIYYNSLEEYLKKDNRNI